MSFKIPKIDQRGTEQIYEQAIKLARVYCPEWKNVFEDTPDKEDVGIVLLKLFSKLTETVIGQLNRVPEKHLLVFYDFIGIDHLPPDIAKVPLTFKLSEGSSEASVPVRTKVSSAEDPMVIFETIEPLTAVNFKIKSAYSLNPWNDKYTNHAADVNGTEKGFYIFDGKDPVPHILYLPDDAFDFKTPADVSIKFTFSNDKDFTQFFSKACDGDGKPFLDESGNQIELNLTRNVSDKSLTASFKKKILIPKKSVNEDQSNWISFRPKDTLLAGEPLPEINDITCDVMADGILPDAALFNDTPVDVKKGFYPFGETPKIGDALYIGCDEAFSKKDAKICMTFDISFDETKGLPSADLEFSWEYLDETEWKPLAVEPNSYKFTTTGTISFKCPSIRISTLHGIQSKWIRVRIKKGNYGKPGRYESVKSIDDIIKTVSIPKTEIANVLSDVRTEIITALKNEHIIIPDEKIDIIFKPFQINPGRLRENLEGILSKYGEEVKNQLTKEGIISGFIYIPSSYNPPFINSLTIGYSYTNKPVHKCKTYNNFEYHDVVSPLSPFKPFHQLSESPTFYIGFEGNPANKPVSLYFSQKGILYDEEVPRIKEPGYTGNFALNEKVQDFMCKYYDGKEWIEFVKEDGTDLFSKSGIIKFIIPSNISKQTLFKDENLYWIKLVLKDGSWFEPPKLKGIFPNTVRAENATVIKDELLGSSNGEGNQVFNFSSKPLLIGQVIEIKEPGIPSEDELKAIERDEGSDALRIIKNDSGDIQEVWVRWHEVKTFVHSDSLSRHYIIDRVNGMIMFGDGIHGMIPPALPNNILAREYKSGGGKKGNQKEKTLTGLKTTIPNIDNVTNYDSSAGGRDLELIGDILKRTPHSIKNGGKAVTKEDFEWLAMEASPEVAKARCIRNGEKIMVVIAPVYANGTPSPETSLTDYVETYLKERAFAPIRESIEVIGPKYKSIYIETSIVPLIISESSIVADRVEGRLKEYLNPITGGQDKKGWDFGEDIFLSEVAAVIEDVEGVDYIKELKVNENTIGGISFVEIRDNELPCAGEIIVNLIGGKD